MNAQVINWLRDATALEQGQRAPQAISTEWASSTSGSDRAVQLRVSEADATADELNRSNDVAVAKFLELYARDLIPEIERTGVESGLVGYADEILQDAVAENSLAAMAALQEAFVKNVKKPAIAAGLVTLASRLPQPQVGYMCAVIAMSACLNRSAEVQEAGIMAIEAWDFPERQDILDAMQPSLPWLTKYRDAVLHDIREH